MKLHLFMDALGKSFDRDDRLAIGTFGRIDARDYGFTIDQDGTRTAFRLFATDLRAGQVQALAQERGKGLARLWLEGILLAVDNKIYI
jgi:hypothetical protein